LLIVNVREDVPPAILNPVEFAVKDKPLMDVADAAPKVPPSITTFPLLDGNVIVVPSVPANVKELLAASVFPLEMDKVPVVVEIVNPLMDVAVAAPNAPPWTTTLPLPEGNVIVVPSVPANVKELLAVNVLPFAIDKVPVVLLIVRPLIDVAVAAPRAPPWITTFPLVDGNVIVVPSVPASVKEFLTAKVLDVVPPTTLKPVESAVNVRPSYVLFVKAILFVVVATTVVSILNAFPVLSNGAVTETCPAPEKGAKEIAVVPTSIGSIVPVLCNTYPMFAFVDP